MKKVLAGKEGMMAEGGQIDTDSALRNNRPSFANNRPSINHVQRELKFSNKSFIFKPKIYRIRRNDLIHN
jgi:hypothetical protein